LSAVIALNLAAVTQSQLDWARIVWTFPVITIIGCVPFYCRWRRVREAAALTFLGLYNVPPGDCVAAALLTLVIKLTWAMIGGAVLWREESLYRARPNHFQAQTVSVVIPPERSGQPGGDDSAGASLVTRLRDHRGRRRQR